ncbi:MAG: hypothetical protein GY697_17115 [Desulfobacterales bacterium]|nr:hypothetical protein [Desulfobacterales bacterium]
MPVNQAGDYQSTIYISNFHVEPGVQFRYFGSDINHFIGGDQDMTDTHRFG